MEERFLGQLLLTGIPGPRLDPETAARLRRLQPGGFILFGRNIESPAQLRTLIDDLRDLSGFPPVVAIDQEGGRVSRLRLIGNEPPSARQLREKGERRLIEEHGRLTGRLLRLFGFNLDLCPVLDIAFDDEADNSLKGRCYGVTANEVIDNASTFNAALRAERILSCGKHFPGYSRAAVDAHEELPVIPLTREALEEHELAPFRALAPDLDSIMTCHSHYPAWDSGRPRWPASLSRNIVTGVLRDQLGYEGLIMTDDLDMGAILREVSFPDVIRCALEAGNDMLMICHRLEMVESAKGHLAHLPHSLLDAALERIEKLKRHLAPPMPFSQEAFAALDHAVWDLRVNTLGPLPALERSPEDGKRSPVETY